MTQSGTTRPVTGVRANVVPSCIQPSNGAEDARAESIATGERAGSSSELLVLLAVSIGLSPDGSELES